MTLFDLFRIVCIVLVWLGFINFAGLALRLHNLWMLTFSSIWLAIILILFPIFKKSSTEEIDDDL
jgi:hypothetical protein